MAQGKYRRIVAESFAVGVGGFGALVMYALIALVFLVPGVIILLKELKKPKEERKTAVLVLGFGISFIGVAVGFGMGADVVFELLGSAMSG